MAASMTTNLRRVPQTIRKLRSALSGSGVAATKYTIDHPVEEELLPGDRLRYFYPTRPEETLGGNYKVITKLGFGTGSTVWLAENLGYRKDSPLPRYVTVKIGALDTDAEEELKISKRIATAKPSHEGLLFLRKPIDNFQIKGPNGSHFCLVYEPMRGTLLSLQHRLPKQKLPLPLFKLFVYGLLQALDYLHNECHLIHTDLKDDNILLTIEDGTVLEDFVAAQKQTPMPRHIREDGSVIYLSQDLGPFQGFKLLPGLSDFDSAYPGLPDNRGHLSVAQPHRYRAPEGLLGAPWSYSADVWNLGLLMWNLLENVSLFDKLAGEDGEYDAHVHLAHMITLLGPPPERLVERELLCRRYQVFRPPLVNPRGRACENTNQYWGGPFFDEKGQMIRRNLLISGGQKLADTVTELAGDEKQGFLDFAGGMLRWLPEERKTAKELLKHPFLQSFYDDRARFM